MAVRQDHSPDQALQQLATSAMPHLIGVRHHSPALAAAMPALLQAAQPDLVLLELPADLQHWLPWLAHPETLAPVALAAEGTAFYPFADFSPELAALRWCRQVDVPVLAFDLPAGALLEDPLPSKAGRIGSGAPLAAGPAAAADPVLAHVPSVVDALLARQAGAGDLWDHLVEARAADAAPESLRRAALLAGWAMRLDSPALCARDAAREAHMRQVLADQRALGAQRPVAVLGSFHAAALIDQPCCDPLERQAFSALPCQPVTSALLPYAFELFDDRSGYPAGIRDPAWRQELWLTLCQTHPDVEQLTQRLLVEIARRIRASRHVAGLPDVRAAAQMARDLARIRDLPAPGRAELLEAITSTLGQGEPLGRGRVIARALEEVLVGRRRGRVAAEAPRCGLVPHVEALLAELKLPGPEQAGRDPKPLRLDPLRSPLDGRRHVAMHQLAACHVPYAELRTSGRELLTAVWLPQWVPATEAMLAVAGLRGATLPQAAEGALRAERRQRLDQGESPASVLLAALTAAAECGLGEWTAQLARELPEALATQGDLAQLVAAVGLHDRIAAGHIAGTAGMPDLFASDTRDTLLRAAVQHVESMAGSTEIASVSALLELVQLAREFDSSRLRAALAGLAEHGSPLMRGAATAAQVLAGRATASQLGIDASSALDWPESAARAAFWQGAWIVAGPLLEADPALLEPLVARIEAASDAEFLRLLPSLREGFQVLSPAARLRILAECDERLGTGRSLGELAAPAEWLAQLAAEDAARQRLAEERFGPFGTAGQPPSQPLASGHPRLDPCDCSGFLLSTADRWRLMLGQHNRRRLSPPAAGYGHCLEALYGDGAGQGEGGHGELAAGSEPAHPTMREWAHELQALFGEDARQEVLARAAERGQPQAALELDAEAVRPSVELLQAILAHKGGLSEDQLSHLRRLVNRIVAELVQELAVRLRPALHGLGTPQVSRRPRGRLDLRRTLRANLQGVRPERDPPLLPERFYFRTRAKKTLDWRVILVVDVSGSMEPSVIYAALVAAILAGMPAFSVDFLAFSTDVVDLTGHVSDPLGLLLEVHIGGGTLIGQALRVARERVAVPNRTLLLLLSDFEDGGPPGLLLEQIRALVESGVIALGLAALDDVGQPRYSRPTAELAVAAGMPVAALTPLALARWIGEQVQ